MTLPAPSAKENGWPRSQEASNCLPVEYETPTYCTETFLPATASAPVPTIRSCFWSVVGGGPDGTVTVGFVPLLAVPVVLLAFLSPPLLQADGPSATTTATATRAAVRRL